MRHLLSVLLIVGWLPVVAQSETWFHVTERGDTVRYTYTPTSDGTAQLVPQEPQKKGFLRRVVDYFGQSTEDHTFDKKIDITFAGGPSYSKTTKLGLGVLAAGLYRLDRTDSITPPSDISIFANVTTSGFYSFGVTGNTIFRNSVRRLSYDVSFSSAPRDVWGIGYDAGRFNPKSDFVEQSYIVKARFLQRLFTNTYGGVMLNFNHTSGRKFDEVSESYIYGQKHAYTATGFGALLEYDSRDFIPNPSRGHYLSIEATYFAKALGNCDRSLWRIAFTANTYKQLWSSGLIAFDLHGEFNSEGTPWTLLARLGGNERMRGYYLGQYTDNSTLTFQMELRQRIWRRIGCVIWGGAGNVFSDREKFSWSKTLPNYGVGLRWELKKRVNVRMDYGFGRKTGGFLLSINEAF